MKGNLHQDENGKYFREGDLPKDELVRMAEKVVKAVEDAHPIEAEVHFKFTCEKCGERCTFEEPNRIFELGTCHACGHDTPFVIGGFMIAYKFGGPGLQRHQEK